MMVFNSAAVLARGVALGLSAAVPIGPVNVQIARRALAGKALAGFALGCGAVTADVTYAALSSLSFARLLNRPLAVNLIGAAGAILLAYLGAGCLAAAAKAWNSDPIGTDDHVAPGPDDRPDVAPAAKGRAAQSSYITGLLMTLLNPMTLAFWFTVVPAATAVTALSGADSPAVPLSTIAGHADHPPGHDRAKLTQEAAGKLPITCAGVFIGTLAWVVAFSGLLAWAGRRRRNWWLATADVAGGATLIFFALVMVWRLTRPFI